MYRCNHCNVDVNMDTDVCPLCQAILTGDECGVDDPFPKIPTIYKSFSLLFKILIFISISGNVVCLMLNLLIETEIFWALFVLGGTVSTWILLVATIRKKENIRKTVMYYVVLIDIIAVLWDYFTNWNGWSIDFVIPISCVVAMILFAILYKVMNAPITEYLFYFFIDGFFGIIPIIFYYAGVLNTAIPSLICVTVSLISICAIIVFLGKDLFSELKRRFHL